MGQMQQDKKKLF